jgi:hypothetical protein
MDIHVLDTINKANANIEELIDKIVSFEKSQCGLGRCCYGGLIFRPKLCEGNCDVCKEKYYKKMYDDMLDKYYVNL